MSDVANVIMAPENNKLAAWANGTPSLILNIQRQPGANVIQVADAVKRLLPQVKADMPPALEITVLSDRTETIRASVADVEFELVLAVVLVVLVIFVFLRNLPATIIPSLSVPLSLVGTFGVMYLLNYSLDNLSLMALTISTGFVVDDAIVMIENIARYIESGRRAARRSAQGLAADRLHHHLAHGIADRGTDSAAVHGRDRRPAVPRVCHHAGRDHRDLRRRVAHPRADAVRPAAASPPAGGPRRVGLARRAAAFSGSSAATSAP